MLLNLTYYIKKTFNILYLKLKPQDLDLVLYGFLYRA